MAKIVDKQASAPIESVFFEQQFGSLCGEHCLNNALQDKLFDAVTLASLGASLDAEERQLRFDEANSAGGGGRGSSNNFDDTGYFSVNVLESALGQFGLNLVPLNKTDDDGATKARAKPENQKLYIFHEKDHWYCARRFAEKQWVLLDSTKAAPSEITDVQLSSMVQSNNTSRQVFVVLGSLTKREADEVYSRVMLDENGVARVFRDKGHTLGSTENNADLERGIAMSLGKTNTQFLREQRAKFLQQFEQKKNESQPDANSQTKS